MSNKRVKQDLPKFLEIDELEKLEKPLADKIKTLLVKDELVYSCALRISEATNLLSIHIDLDKQYVDITARNSKGGRGRRVYIPDPAIKILREWEKIRPINDNPYFFCNVKGSTTPGDGPKPISRLHYNRLINNLAEISGVRMAGEDELVKPHPHTLRHTRAMSYMDAELPLAVIQKILGHRNITTTQVYANVRQSVTDNAQKENVAGIINF